MSPVCANCEEMIVSAPFLDEGQTYCCSGCAHGGPCICTYRAATADASNWNETPTAPEVIEAPAATETQYATASTAPAAEPQPEPEQEPVTALPSQPLAWPAPDRAAAAIARRPSILRISGLQAQTELLQLGDALEQPPEIEDLSLVRAELDDVWFAVSVRDSHLLAEALVRLDGFTVDARPHPAGVDATIRLLPADSAVAEVAPATESIVPAAARSLFRLFQGGDERGSEPEVAIETVASRSLLT